MVHALDNLGTNILWASGNHFFVPFVPHHHGLGWLSSCIHANQPRACELPGVLGNDPVMCGFGSRGFRAWRRILVFAVARTGGKR